MPLYEYECAACHHRFEKIEKFNDSTRRACPKCGKRAERVLAAPAIQFKGSGWYVTDYGRGKPAESKTSEKAEAKTEKAAESAKTTGNGAQKSAAPAAAKPSSKKKD